MNFKISLISFLLLLALSLIAFAFSLVGVAGSVVDSVWKLIALCIGVSLVIGFAYPHLRGVKKGDLLSTNTVYFDSRNPAAIMSIFAGPTAVALQNGRIGERIKVNSQGRQAEAIVLSYASTFSHAVVRITEVEQAPQYFKV